MGKDEREAKSPSFFNVTEIQILVSYLTKLFETQGKKGIPKLLAKDIGIIAPYRKQVSEEDLCFSKMWTKRICIPLSPVKGGENQHSPEAWPRPKAIRWPHRAQGNGCVTTPPLHSLASTSLLSSSSGGARGGVSGTGKENHHDLHRPELQRLCQDGPGLQHRVPLEWKGCSPLMTLKVSHFWGRKTLDKSFIQSCLCCLLSFTQRFNVAMTRARSLLIVVGNPVILNKDPTWAK